MNKKNIHILRQMIILSKQTKLSKEARCILQRLQSNATYFIVEGERSNNIFSSTVKSIDETLNIELYLRSSVSNMCTCLDGFSPNSMEPIDYISSSDIKNKYVDLCYKGRVVAAINLSTGKIERIPPEQELQVEDKSLTE